MSKSRFLLYQFVITALVILFLELGARVAFTFAPDRNRQGDWFSYTADLGWNRRPNFDGSDLCGKHRKFDSRGLLSIDATKLANETKPRVLFVGDSTMYGFCVDSPSTYVEVANESLPQYSMINIGMAGYSSFQGYKSLLKYGDLIKPDIVFISFNWNDRRSARDAILVDSEATFGELARKSSIYNLLDYSYLFRFARFVGKKLGLVGAEGRKSSAKVRLDNLRPRVDRRGYKANLINMVKWARQRGAVPMFILLGDSPFHSAELRRGVGHLAERDYAEAIRDLVLAAERPRSELLAIAKLYLSAAYKKEGRIDEAEQVLDVAPFFAGTLNDGGQPLLLDADYNKIMIEVSHEYDVPLIDAKTELEKVPTVFFDDVHFDAEGHQVVARLVKDALTGGDWRGDGKEGER